MSGKEPMPIYEFECQSCDHRFDRLQKLSDPDPETCPECGKAQVKRALTAASFRLKGAGWYETDFKGEQEKKRNLVESATPAAATGEKAAGDGKTDSKTETKPESKPATTPAASSAPAAAAAD